MNSKQVPDVLVELVKVQKQYIKLLGKDIDRTSGYLHVHGMYPKDADVKKGAKLRAKIKELEDKLKG